MKKPEKKNIVCWDYSECVDYIEKKYKIDTRNVLGHSFACPEPKDNPEYCDFWHFVIDAINPSRGGICNFYEEMAHDAEPWQKQVLKYFFDEFGEYDKNSKQKIIVFHTDW